MPDQPAETPRRRDRVRAAARRAAPYAGAALAGAAVAAVVLTGRKTAPSLAAVNALPALPPPFAMPAPSLPRRSPTTHVVGEHVRRGHSVSGYVRPRVRRGPESLNARQLAESLAAS
jgi:hypothetical protein